MPDILTDLIMKMMKEKDDRTKGELRDLGQHISLGANKEAIFSEINKIIEGLGRHV